MWLNVNLSYDLNMQMSRGRVCVPVSVIVWQDPMKGQFCTEWILSIMNIFEIKNKQIKINK